MKRIVLTILLLALPAAMASAQDVLQRSLDYRPGDWVTWSVHRFPASLSYGDTYVYFGSENGVSRYDYTREEWDTPFSLSSGMADDRVRVVAMDRPSGVLWCATATGLSFLLPGIREWRNLSYDRLGVRGVLSIGSGDTRLWLEADDGRLYSGSRQGGPFWETVDAELAGDNVTWQGRRQRPVDIPMLFVDGPWDYLPERVVQDNHFRRFPVTGAVADRFNHLWLAIDGLGGAEANPLTASMRLLPFGLYVDEVRAMAWDGEGMWIGGRSLSRGTGGITFWDMERNRWSVYEAELHTDLYSDRVRSIAVDTVAVWFGTGQGLIRLNKTTGRWRSYTVREHLTNNSITSVALAGPWLWVGTASGINMVHLPDETIRQVRDELVPGRTIHHIEPDGADIWATTDRGLLFRDGETGLWRGVESAPGMQMFRVTAVSAYAGEVWAGSDDGVQVLDKASGEWTGFPSGHYPTGGVIYTILADDEVVWFGTDDGILKFLKKERRWSRFTIDDGLRDNRVYWLLLDGDYLWAGTAAGLTRFYWNAPYRID
ncbi:hypothetical protein JXO52_00900 [bacterium]|nr:hypothetical protein [bacterium]